MTRGGYSSEREDAGPEGEENYMKKLAKMSVCPFVLS